MMGGPRENLFFLHIFTETRVTFVICEVCLCLSHSKQLWKILCLRISFSSISVLHEVIPQIKNLSRRFMMNSLQKSGFFLFPLFRKVSKCQGTTQQISEWKFVNFCFFDKVHFIPVTKLVLFAVCFGRVHSFNFFLLTCYGFNSIWVCQDFPFCCEYYCLANRKILILLGKF